MTRNMVAKLITQPVKNIMLKNNWSLSYKVYYCSESKIHKTEMGQNISNDDVMRLLVFTAMYIFILNRQ